MRKHAFYIALLCMAAVTLLFFQPGIEGASQDTVVLEGLYATSTAMGYDRFGPQNLFGGGKTWWQTMPGAGPDEGVYLDFGTPLKIDSILLEQPANAGLRTVYTVRVIGDGNDMGIFGIKDAIALNATISVLFIRIIDVDGVSTRNVQSDIDNFSKNELSFIPQYVTGFSALHIVAGGKELKIKPPKSVGGNVAASSTLKPYEAYRTDYLFDSRTDSGWVEGAAASGTGESLTFTFDKTVTISKIKIWNGMQMSREHYVANERVKSFTFGTGSGDATIYPLPDSMEPQIVTLAKPLKGTNFIFTIKDVYKGTAYTDTVIAEMRFFDGSDWFFLKSGEGDSLKEKRLSSAKGTVLEKVIDRQLKNIYTAPGMNGSMKSLSIILRSDDSFVIWLESTDYADNKTVSDRKVIDGFWNILSLSGGKASVLLLGRSFQLSEVFQPYVGSQSDTRTAIIMDTVTITDHLIRGAKFLGPISY